MKYNKTLIFLGAGADCAMGLPNQADLFSEFFKYYNKSSFYQSSINTLKQFFIDFFQYNPDEKTECIPTFEQALAMVQIALSKEHNFYGYSQKKLKEIEYYLAISVGWIINHLSDKAQSKKNYYEIMVDKLFKKPHLFKNPLFLPNQIIFVSTNYSVFLDRALAELFHKGIGIDYGIDFFNFTQKKDWKPPVKDQSVLLLKTHGSIHWEYCPVCNILSLPEKGWGKNKEVQDFSKDTPCKQCGEKEVVQPLLQAPTFYKNNNPFLDRVHHKLDNVLKDVGHIIFCGYSLPEADMPILYLLKRAEVNRKNEKLKITVIDKDAKKNNNPCLEKKKLEKDYLSFFKNKSPLFLSFDFKGFENFVEKIDDFLKIE